jgi:hypothetical protein
MENATIRGTDPPPPFTSRPAGCLWQSPERLPKPHGCPPWPNICLPQHHEALSRGFCRDRGGSHKHIDSDPTSGSLLVTPLRISTSNFARRAAAPLRGGIRLSSPVWLALTIPSRPPRSIPRSPCEHPACRPPRTENKNTPNYCL